MKTQRDASGMQGRVGDASLSAKTGRGWRAWFDELDRAGAAKLDHGGIVAAIGAKAPELAGWWRQAIAVGYEQARGLRRVHQKPDGFEASVSKTLAAPASRVFEAWTIERQRLRWIDDAAFSVHKATPTKSLRGSWKGTKAVSVYFVAKSSAKTQVAIQHGKLPDEKAVARMKRYWHKRLETLAGMLS